MNGDQLTARLLGVMTNLAEAKRELEAIKRVMPARDRKLFRAEFATALDAIARIIDDLEEK